MTTEISIKRPEDDQLRKIESWLRDNVGPGCYRTIKNSFMGADDWFYYENELEDEDEDYEYDEDDLNEPDLVFTFRRETDATVFALKWTTTT